MTYTIYTTGTNHFAIYRAGLPIGLTRREALIWRLRQLTQKYIDGGGRLYTLDEINDMRRE